MPSGLFVIIFTPVVFSPAYFFCIFFDAAGPQLVFNLIYRKCKIQQERFPLSLAQQCADLGNEVKVEG